MCATDTMIHKYTIRNVEPGESTSTRRTASLRFLCFSGRTSADRKHTHTQTQCICCVPAYTISDYFESRLCRRNWSCPNAQLLAWGRCGQSCASSCSDGVTSSRTAQASAMLPLGTFASVRKIDMCVCEIDMLPLSVDLP